MQAVEPKVECAAGRLEPEVGGSATLQSRETIGTVAGARAANVANAAAHVAQAWLGMTSRGPKAAVRLIPGCRDTQPMP